MSSSDPGAVPGDGQVSSPPEATLLVRDRAGLGNHVALALQCQPPPLSCSVASCQRVCRDETLSSSFESLTVDLIAFFSIHQIGAEGFPEAKPVVSAFLMKLGSVL